MPEFSGLQIEVRCLKCGRLPGADITLFEMQNHLYICDTCSQEAVQKGKHIAWAQGTQPPTLFTQPLAPASPTGQLTPAKTRTLTDNPPASNLPPDSIFALLGLPLEAPISQLTNALKQQTAAWMKRSDAPEHKKMIALLREWRARLQDEETFEEYRTSIKKLVRGESGAISVGGRSVFTEKDFLDACEELQDGWADGERYLRNGQLAHWILFHLEKRDLALEARRYQKWNAVSDFRALNEMLYCLVRERPFRLYTQDAWQHRDMVPSASTPEELAQLGDLHWQIAERHLYAGAMTHWLEHTRGIQGLGEYYKACVAGYHDKGEDRGVGLEFVLERAVPNLPRPNLVVAFDENEGSYMLKSWDREIAHTPVIVTITNTTRGFVSLNIALMPKKDVTEPDWIRLENARAIPDMPISYANITTYVPGSVVIRGRPGAGLPAREALLLENLPRLARGHTYQRKLIMSVRGEYEQSLRVQMFPVTLKTKWFFQGMRGILWGWGLRGGLPGLCWHFAVGALLTLLPLWLFTHMLPNSLLYNAPVLSSFNDFIQLVAAATLSALQFMGLQFALIGGGIAGCAGFWVGRGKGHQNYSGVMGAKAFRMWGFWLAILFAIILVFWNHGNEVISQALQPATYGYSGSTSAALIIIVIAASLITGLLIVIIICVIAALRQRLEKFLRAHYEYLLNPPGKA